MIEEKIKIYKDNKPCAKRLIETVKVGQVSCRKPLHCGYNLN